MFIIDGVGDRSISHGKRFIVWQPQHPVIKSAELAEAEETLRTDRGILLGDEVAAARELGAAAVGAIT
jgi:hypothetical protein